MTTCITKASGRGVLPALVAGLGLVAGCGGGGPKLVGVAGTVYYLDKPFGGVNVVFQPAPGSAPDLKPATGYAAADGSFTLYTNDAGKGAMVGRYKVALVADPHLPPKLAKYGQPKTTPLTVDVPPDGLPNCELKLK